MINSKMKIESLTIPILYTIFKCYNFDNFVCISYFADYLV